MSNYVLKGKELCWDKYLWDKSEGVSLRIHKPEENNVVIEQEDKGNTLASFIQIIKVEDKYRMYYSSHNRSGEGGLSGGIFYMAESDDGINFTKPSLGMFEFKGSKDNNIYFTEDRFVDNFTVHYDENPDCPKDEKYKALSLFVSNNFYTTELGLYVSPDGVDFTFKKILPIKGVFDSMNIIFWDKKDEVYKLYIRDFHGQNGEDVTYEPTEAMEKAIRDVRLVTSKDLETFSKPEKIKFQESAEDIELYVSQVMKYPGTDLYFGLPTRYKNRVADIKNFDYLPKWQNRQKFLDEGNRQGTALTDCAAMTSRDGFHFDRFDSEAFVKPGLEETENWAYGDGYISHGFALTPIEGNPDKKEMSFFMTKGKDYSNRKIVRLTTRLDGIFSWRGDFEGATLLTKPLILDGDSMNINFSTSSMGSINIKICTADGNEIEGYDSKTIFGDSLSRPVDFEKPLSALKGKEVRIKFSLRDCDLYSFELK